MDREKSIEVARRLGLTEPLVRAVQGLDPGGPLGAMLGFPGELLEMTGAELAALGIPPLVPLFDDSSFYVVCCHDPGAGDFVLMEPEVPPREWKRGNLQQILLEWTVGLFQCLEDEAELLRAIEAIGFRSGPEVLQSYRRLGPDPDRETLGRWFDQAWAKLV